MPDPANPIANPILLYDGVCGLCNRVVQFILKRDPHARFRFASLQSDYAARILGEQGLESSTMHTLYVVEPGNRLSARSDAVIRILRGLGGFWRAGAAVLRLFPKPLRDWGYDQVAHHRYRIFGKYESCPLPDQQYQDRFLDL